QDNKRIWPRSVPPAGLVPEKECTDQGDAEKGQEHQTICLGIQTQENPKQDQVDEAGRDDAKWRFDQDVMSRLDYSESDGNVHRVQKELHLQLLPYQLDII